MGTLGSYQYSRGCNPCQLEAPSSMITPHLPPVDPSLTIDQVYAPSTNSLPPLKPVPNPFGSGNPPCEISVISCGSRFRMLGQVSPKFDRIWNGRSNKRRSFMNVSIEIFEPKNRINVTAVAKFSKGLLQAPIMSSRAYFKLAYHGFQDPFYY